MPRDLHGLRLLLIGNWPPPPGGVSTHVKALREAARAAGAHVTVLDIGSGQSSAEGVFESGDEWQFLSRLFAMTRSHDIVHLHTNGANAKSWALTGAVGRVSRGGPCRPVVTFHSGHATAYLHPTFRRLMAGMALAPYERVVCVNEEISNVLSRALVSSDRRLVAPAYGGEQLRPAALPHDVAAFVERHSPIVSAMLAPGRDYGGVELVAAFERIRDAHPESGLIVYGPGTEDMSTARLCGAVSEATLRLGPVDRPAALAVMKASDVFVRPTLVDGDAVSVREALALGKRVVATRVGHRPSGVALCAARDANDLASTILRALASAPPRVINPTSDGVETVLQLYAQLARDRLTLAA